MSWLSALAAAVVSEPLAKCRDPLTSLLMLRRLLGRPRWVSKPSQIENYPHSYDCIEWHCCKSTTSLRFLVQNSRPVLVVFLLFCWESFLQDSAISPQNWAESRVEQTLQALCSKMLFWNCTCMSHSLPGDITPSLGFSSTTQQDHPPFHRPHRFHSLCERDEREKFLMH